MIHSALEDKRPEPARYAPRVLLIATDLRVARDLRQALRGGDARTLEQKSDHPTEWKAFYDKADSALGRRDGVGRRLRGWV
jgi:hypothetical protein